jgi:hypothetical protein
MLSHEQLADFGIGSHVAVGTAHFAAVLGGHAVVEVKTTAGAVQGAMYEYLKVSFVTIFVPISVFYLRTHIQVLFSKGAEVILN